MKNGVYALWSEPRPPMPSLSAWWDRTLVALLVLASVLEGAFRDVFDLPSVVVLLSVLTAIALLWRRTHPLAAFVIPFAVGNFVALLVGPLVPAYSSVFSLLLVYSLFRWGAGWEATIGLFVMCIGYALSVFGSEGNSLGEFVGGGVVFLFPSVVGTAVRFRATARLRELEQVKLLERELLSRELHDTVAHHISAITIQAQAGQVLADTVPGAALAALLVIEQEAACTLKELRMIVGVLRTEAEATTAPLDGIANIIALADDVGKPRVEVELSGDLGNLPPSLAAALFRLAQESVTNARRHAREANRIQVRLVGKPQSVHLHVRDDGRRHTFDTSASSGFGLVGMSERVSLLRGTFEAGPAKDGGWTVDAVLPRNRDLA